MKRGQRIVMEKRGGSTLRWCQELGCSAAEGTQTKVGQGQNLTTEMTTFCTNLCLKPFYCELDLQHQSHTFAKQFVKK